MESTTAAVQPTEQLDTARAGGAADKFYLEEFKVFTGAIFDIDKRVGQVFGFTIAASVSLFSWIAKFVIEDQTSPVPLAYVALVPNLIVLPAFFYLLAQRRDLIGFAAYLRLLERRLGVKGFQTGLGSEAGSLRVSKLRGGESNDPIPYSFWAIFLISAALFAYGINQRSGGPHHLLALTVPCVLLGLCHWKWKCLIPQVLPELTRKWMAQEEKGNAP